jgi:hypothetical protein
MIGLTGGAMGKLFGSYDADARRLSFNVVLQYCKIFPKLDDVGGSASFVSL